MRKNSLKKGFTLIEVLVVIGIIAILAAIVIVAINPKKHFDDAKESQRSANVNAILNAVSQYTVDNKGALPSIPDGEITPALCAQLVPGYIGAIPTDPDSTLNGAAVAAADCAGIVAGNIAYSVSDDASGHVTVCATIPDPDICVTR